jgi:hypothetical protein
MIHGFARGNPPESAGAFRKPEIVTGALDRCIFTCATLRSQRTYFIGGKKGSGPRGRARLPDFEIEAFFTFTASERALIETQRGVAGRSSWGWRCRLTFCA